MTRVMRDSTSPADIPVSGTQIVAGYANGRYAWPAADWGRFPGAGHAPIDVNGSDPHGSVILDVETGDATVGEAVLWSKARLTFRPNAYVPIIYCNRSTLTPLFNAMTAGGLQIVKHFRLWVATLDGTKTVPDMTGVTAVQAYGQSHTGGHYDESIVYDDHWLSTPTPAPPAPKPVQHGELVTLSPLGTHPLVGRAVQSTDGGVTWR